MVFGCPYQNQSIYMIYNVYLYFYTPRQQLHSSFHKILYLEIHVCKSPGSWFYVRTVRYMMQTLDGSKSQSHR